MLQPSRTYFIALVLACLATATSAAAGSMGLAKSYNATTLGQQFMKVDRPAISDVSANNFIDIFAPILRGHPESMEGNATAKIAFEKTSDGKAYVVEIELSGLLDDSVSGQKYVGIVEPGNNTIWKLQSLWLRQKCARGSNAGKWIKGTCG